MEIAQPSRRHLVHHSGMLDASITARLAEQARSIGFDLCGVARAENNDQPEHLPEWLARGYAGEMRYLHDARRHSIPGVLPGARSVIVCALNYNTPLPYSTAALANQSRDAGIKSADSPPRAWISRYAWGHDYHDVLKPKLDGLVSWLRAELHQDFQSRVYVDTGPVLERLAAKHAGLGWLAKNTCLINQQLGSWLFLGVILTDLDLAPTLAADHAPPRDLCGTCTRCIDACPTGAFVAPYVLTRAAASPISPSSFAAPFRRNSAPPWAPWFSAATFARTFAPGIASLQRRHSPNFFRAKSRPASPITQTQNLPPRRTLRFSCPHSIGSSPSPKTIFAASFVPAPSNAPSGAACSAAPAWPWEAPPSRLKIRRILASCSVSRNSLQQKTRFSPNTPPGRSPACTLRLPHRFRAIATLTARQNIHDSHGGKMISAGSFISHFIAGQPHFSFPENAVANEEIVLRWIHIVAGIIWIGLLYFVVLVGTPVLKGLEDVTRRKVYPALISRSMLWIRWSALITVVVGLRYYMILLQADAQNSGDPALQWRWLGEWFLVWLVAYAIIYALQMPFGGPLANGWLRAILIAVVVIAASWVILAWNAGADVSNAHLCISVGGGLGLLMLMNLWGIIWRVQKRMIEWTRASVENGTPIPGKAAKMVQFSTFATRTAFWLSFPMLFFMAASEHYPFLSSIGH